MIKNIESKPRHNGKKYLHTHTHKTKELYRIN